MLVYLDGGVGLPRNALNLRPRQVVDLYSSAVGIQNIASYLVLAQVNPRFSSPDAGTQDTDPALEVFVALAKDVAIITRLPLVHQLPELLPHPFLPSIARRLLIPLFQKRRSCLMPASKTFLHFEGFDLTRVQFTMVA